MRNRIKIIGVACASVAMALGAWWLAPDGENAGRLKPNDDQVVTLGQSIYKAQCASCHGTDLEGEPNWRQLKPDGTMPAPPHNKRGHTWHHSDEVLFRLTKFGLAAYLNNPDYKSAMPAYENILTDNEIVAVLSYIKSTWPEEIRKRHDRLNEQ